MGGGGGGTPILGKYGYVPRESLPQPALFLAFDLCKSKRSLFSKDIYVSLSFLAPKSLFYVWTRGGFHERF